ncbi:hypothetical protein RB596_007706 [Gaeumannomyces avenae]
MMASEDSLAPRVVGVNIAMMTVSSLAIAGRVTVSAVTMRNLWIDDAMSVIAWLFLMALLILVILMTTVGFGSHFEDVSPEMLEMYLRYGLPTFSLYVLGSLTAKLAYAFYYLRLFSDRQHALLNHALIVFLVLQGLGEGITSHLMCTPFSKALVPTIPGTCSNVGAFYLSFFGIKLFTDIILFVQPIPVLWGLRLSAGKKTAMFALVSLGMCVCIFSVVRIRLVPLLYTGDDPTYTIVDAMLWSEVEIFSLIVCECVPALRKLGARMGPVVAALVFVTATASKPANANSNDQPSGGGDAGEGGSRRKRRGGRCRGSRTSSKYAGGGGGSSASSSRGSRFGVTSLVSATRRSDNNDSFGFGQSSARTIVGQPEPPEPTHGSIMVTRDIEIGIEVNESADEDDDDEDDDGDDYTEQDDDDMSGWEAGGGRRQRHPSSLSLGAKPVEPLEPV